MDAAVLRRWWHWQSRQSAVDWVFLGFLGVAGAAFSAQSYLQHRAEAAFRTTDDCLAQANAACANAAVERLAQLGLQGPRFQIAALDAKLLTEGWTPASADALGALQATVGEQGVSGAELLLARGDAEVARGHGPDARRYWASATGKGVDYLVDLRVARLNDQEHQAALQAEQARSEQEAARRAAAQDQREQGRLALAGVIGRARQDFEAAVEEARQGRAEALRVRLGVLRGTIYSLPSDARNALQAALSALENACWAVQRIDSARAQIEQFRSWPTHIREQRTAELSRQILDDQKKRDAALALAREQFDDGMRLVSMLPVEFHDAPPVKVFQVDP